MSQETVAIKLNGPGRHASTQQFYPDTIGVEQYVFEYLQPSPAPDSDFALKIPRCK